MVSNFRPLNVGAGARQTVPEPQHSVGARRSPTPRRRGGKKGWIIFFGMLSHCASEANGWIRGVVELSAMRQCRSAALGHQARQPPATPAIAPPSARTRPTRPHAREFIRSEHSEHKSERSTAGGREWTPPLVRSAMVNTTNHFTISRQHARRQQHKASWLEAQALFFCFSKANLPRSPAQGKAFNENAVSDISSLTSQGKKTSCE